MKNKKDFSPSPQDAECVVVPVRLDRATYEFCKELCDGTDVPLDECLAFLIRSEFHRHLIVSRLAELGLPFSVSVVGVTPFLPVSKFILEVALYYIDNFLALNKEVSSDE